MGNVALMMRSKGHIVTGSDQNMYPPMSEILINEGVTLFEGFSEKNIVNPDLIVIGNKLSRGNCEVEFVLNNKLCYTSMSELLKHEIIQGLNSIVVTGTHGKTTTSSLLAWVFDNSNFIPNFIIGGALGNYGVGWQYNKLSEYLIIEGDEYDTSFFDKRSKFIHYLPSDLIINNVEFDHADIFSSLDEIKLSFKRLVNIVPSNGLIVCNGEDLNALEVIENSYTEIQTFGLSDNCNWRAENIVYSDKDSTYNLYFNDIFQFEIKLNLLGEFNVKNSLAVIAISRKHGIDYNTINKAFASFVNTKRRLELKGIYSGINFYDDFAHHPTAIKATLKALRVKHPNQKIIAVFEPRSNTTRRNIFQKELVDCFDDSNLIILSEIDRLDELSEDKRLNPKKIIDDLNSKGKEAFYLKNSESIVDYLKETLKINDVVVVMSNGGFDNIHNKIKNIFDV